MKDSINDQNKMIAILDWSYDKALKGIPGLDSSEEMAQSYLNKSNNVEDAIDSLIKWQKAKCATSGFVTGVGGLLTMPVALPANLTSVIYIQLRMIAAIAFMCGYNPRDDQVRTLAYICLCGNKAKDIAKVAGIKIGQKLTEKMIKKIPDAVLKKINQMVGFRLLAKFGPKAAINFGKLIPLVGGLIGGSFDYFATSTIGKVTKKMFME